MIMTSKILFLDFDGVLNSRDYIQSISSTWTTEQLDPKAVELLNQIVLQTSCKVVVSSTWRILKTKEQLIQILKSYGFVGDVIGVTPQLYVPLNERGHEIQLWLDHHLEVSQFSIVDDDSDMAHLLPKLVKTKFQTGLQQEHATKIIEMLNESN